MSIKRISRDQKQTMRKHVNIAAEDHQRRQREDDKKVVPRELVVLERILFSAKGKDAVIKEH